MTGIFDTFPIANTWSYYGSGICCYFWNLCVKTLKLKWDWLNGQLCNLFILFYPHIRRLFVKKNFVNPNGCCKGDKVVQEVRMARVVRLVKVVNEGGHWSGLSRSFLATFFYETLEGLDMCCLYPCWSDHIRYRAHICHPRHLKCDPHCVGEDF